MMNKAEFQPHNSKQEELKGIIAGLPKVELHRHLPGAVRLSTIIDLAQKKTIELPTMDPQELRHYAQVMPGTTANLSHILGTVSTFLQICFVSREVVARITFEALEDAWNDGIHYLELRFSPGYLGERYNLSLKDVMAGVYEGLDKGRKQYPIKVGLLLGMTRGAPEDILAQTTDLALNLADDGNVVGVDLSGDEAGHPARAFTKHFERIRSDGRLGITIHAGEASGPESVREAVEYLGAHRIGHGVRVVHDLAVMELVCSRNITLETCPTSNVLTGAVPNLASHPLPQLLRADIRATINTDDPSWFDITLTDEYYLSLVHLGLSFAELKGSALHAVGGAFASQSDKDKLAAIITAAYNAAAPKVNQLLRPD